MTHKATTQDVLDVLDNQFIPYLTKTEIIKAIVVKVNEEIPQNSGSPFNYDKSASERYASVLSLHSVDKALADLIEAGEVVSVKGSHWATGRDYRANKSTFYLSRKGQAVVAERADAEENAKIRARAEEQATQIVLDRHLKEWEEERDVIIAAVTPPDHALLWEPYPEPEDPEAVG